MESICRGLIAFALVGFVCPWPLIWLDAAWNHDAQGGLVIGSILLAGAGLVCGAIIGSLIILLVTTSSVKEKRLSLYALGWGILAVGSYISAFAVAG